MTRRKHTPDFKLKVALAALKGECTVPELCQRFGVASAQVYKWKSQLEQRGGSVFADKREAGREPDIERLHAKIGQLTVENDFLAKVLKR